MKPTYFSLAVVAVAIAMAAGACKKDGAEGASGAEVTAGQAVAAAEEAAESASEGDDYADPVVDESSLIGGADSLNFDPSELSLPPRRFYSKERAMDYMEQSEDRDRYLEGILPRMLEENLEYADRLLNSSFDYFIVADKQSMNVVLFDRYGRMVKSYPMAAAKNYGTKHRKRDSRTPEGFFYAQGVYDSTDWLFTDDDGHTSPRKGQYGPRYIRVTNMIGIHGTGSPRSLGKRASHGCMRVSNESIMDLVKYVRPGMPIIVNPGDRDVAVNRSEGYDICQINVGLDASGRRDEAALHVSSSYPAAPDRAGREAGGEPVAVADSVAIHHAADSVIILNQPGASEPDSLR